MLPVSIVLVVMTALWLVAKWASRPPAAPDRAEGALMPEALYTVRVAPDGVSCLDPDGTAHAIAWEDLTSIRIHTSDSGPWGIDVVWGFHGAEGDAPVVVPQGATGESRMLAALSELPGWRDEEVIAAMGCTANREFICWERRDPA